jgi:predicted transcriptional regulator of viral defense system
MRRSGSTTSGRVAGGSGSSSGSFVRRGALMRLTWGTYAAAAEVPVGPRRDGWRPGAAPHAYAAAARVSADGVIAYRSALELLGVLRPRPDGELIIVSRTGWQRGVRWGGVRMLTREPPIGLVRSDQCALGVQWVRRDEISVRITGPERTFVDGLDRPDLVGSWGEVLAALAALIHRHQFNWGVLRAYVRHLGRRTTAGRVGWVLEQGAAWNGVPEPILADLAVLGPAGPSYFVWRDRERCAEVGGRYATRWKLMVPEEIVMISREVNRRMRALAAARRPPSYESAHPSAMRG